MAEESTVYKQVISILEAMTPEDYPRLIFEIARNYPDALIGARAVMSDVSMSFDEKLRLLIKIKGKIHAIKYARAEKFWGLVEAKEYIESLMDTPS